MSDVRDTAPADSAKPAACGACGGMHWFELVDREWFEIDDRGSCDPEIQIACPCGVRGPRVPAKPSLEVSRPLAFAAWNAMWAPGAGEATKTVVEGAAKLLRYVRGPEAFEKGVVSNVVRMIGEHNIDAALAELGLAGGEGRG